MKRPAVHTSLARHPALLSGLLAALLAGCVTNPPAQEPPKAASTSAPAPTATAARPPATAKAPGAAVSAPTAAARPPAPGTPQPFAEVTRDAKSTAGFLTVWTKDEKTWLEIPASLLDKPFFLGDSAASGLGERYILPGLMGQEQVVVLRRVANTVQLVAVNLKVRATPGTPLARALRESYADSLLAAAPLAAAAHPERKSLLVDAQALLGGDLKSMQTRLEVAYRMPYALDRGNSSIERVRTHAQGTSITLRNHFAVPKLPTPPVLAPGAPPPNPAALPSPPRGVPDARSLFLSQTYTLAPLPEAPMATRRADTRVGYFTEPYVDYADPLADPDRRVHLVQRWRLEKKDPAAAVSEPKEPIRVVLDRNIPLEWRDVVREGVLEWNKAFERAGFRNALVVEQQPDDADWTVFEGTRLLAVRWFAMDGPGALAVGPSQGDPRTGEILRGAAIIPDNWGRFERAAAADLPLRSLSSDGDGQPTLQPGEFAQRFMACSFAQEALEQTRFGLELLTLREAFDPNGPEARRYITEGVKATVVHEIGHTLGLRHNFRASAGISPTQLRDPAFTASRGTSNSVMDYTPPNLPLDGEPVSRYHMSTLGPYDFWAIEYGYREHAAADEKATLAAHAAMGERDPALAFSPDEDLATGDPQVNLFDLGDDPMAFAQRQIRLARELWTRTQKRELPADDDYTLYRRNLQRGLNRIGQSVPLLTRYLGGVQSQRVTATSGKALITPVPAAKQRAALDLLLAEVFASESFRLDPAFMSRLGVDQLDRLVQGRFGSTDFSLPNAVLGVQRNALDVLMSDALAGRLADAESKVTDTRMLLGYAEVQQRIREAVWSELKAGRGEIDSLRRNLQREHVRRLVSGLVRPTSLAAADVRAAHRQEALALDSALKSALAAKGWSATARAHLVDSQAMVTEALHVSLIKSGS